MVALGRKYDTGIFLSPTKETCFLYLYTRYLDEDYVPRYARNCVLYNFILLWDLWFSLVTCRWWDVACTLFDAWLHMLRGVLSKLLRSCISIIHRYRIHFTISVTKFALFWVLRVSICSKKPKPYHMSVVF